MYSEAIVAVSASRRCRTCSASASAVRWENSSDSPGSGASSARSPPSSPGEEYTPTELGVTAEAGSLRRELDGTIAAVPPVASTESRASASAEGPSTRCAAARGAIPESSHTCSPRALTTSASCSAPASCRLTVSDCA